MTIGAIQVATMAFYIVRSKITAEATGPSGVGLLGIIDPVVLLIAQLSNLSLPLAAGKFLPAARAQSRQQYGELFVRLLHVLSACSIFGTGLAILMVLVRPSILGAQLASYRSLFLLALLAVPVINLTTLLTVALSALQKVRAAALFGLIAAISSALISGAGVLLAGLYGYYASQLSVSLLVLIAGMVYLLRLEPVPLRRISFSVQRNLRGSIPVLSLAGALCLTSLSSPVADLAARSAVMRAGGLRLLGLFQAAFGLALILRTTVRSTFALFFTPARTGISTTRRSFKKRCISPLLSHGLWGSSLFLWCSFQIGVFISPIRRPSFLPRLSYACSRLQFLFNSSRP